TRRLKQNEIDSDYEANTGHVIVETFDKRDPFSCPSVLVANHGPFSWGKNVQEAVDNAIVLEHVARMANETLRVSPAAKPMPEALINKHFFRKHGSGAYYGQKRPGTAPVSQNRT